MRKISIKKTIKKTIGGSYYRSRSHIHQVGLGRIKYLLALENVNHLLALENINHLLALENVNHHLVQYPIK